MVDGSFTYNKWDAVNVIDLGRLLELTSAFADCVALRNETFRSLFGDEHCNIKYISVSIFHVKSG